MDFFLSSSYIILILALLTIFPTCLCRLSREFETCSQPFKCGNLTNISYPFYGLNRPSYCGHPGFELLGCDQIANPITMMIKSQLFQLLNISYPTSTITAARDDYRRKSGCPDSLNNITVDFSIFQYTPQDANLTLFYGNCSKMCNTTTTFKEFSCPMSPEDVPFCWLTEEAMLLSDISLTSCPNNLFLPVHKLGNAQMDQAGGYFPNVAWNGFELRWIANDDLCQTCLRSGGRCGHDLRSNEFTCFCTDKSKCPFPESNQERRKKLKTTLIIIASSVVGSAMIALVLLCFRRKLGLQNLYILSKKQRNSKDVEVVLERYRKHSQKKYTYGEIKRITNHFKGKLGEGGYGSVYKGKLDDGSPVAVKLLKNPDSDGTEFTNEVISISETNHVNVVSLIGYCFQGRKRALVYDFMPKGSLDKYTYSGKTQNPLAWQTLHQIAIGIGRGLEYLHQGCRTRILHFDIKPHNILLDDKLCPKISDFGLAKPWLQTKSLMTMSGMRGTPGYIAPEVFYRGFGGASHKSDVYSYGMLVLDLVGCRKKNIAGSENTDSELYFPHWIYKQFELEEDQELLGISNDEEKVLQRKMVIVSLWCIQMNPSSRPSISRAVEMLEEDLESLQIPPIPILSSPPKAYTQNSSASSMSL